MLTWKFWRQVLERAVKSAAQSLLLLWAADSGFSIVEADFALAGGAAAGAFALSVLSSLVTAGIGEKDDPSMITRS